MSQIDTENDKKPKIFNFQRIYAFFDRIRDWNVSKGQQGKRWLSSSLF